MHIDVAPAPLDEKIKEKINPGIISVIIDVLRVSSTMVTALESGARRIFPAETVEEAFEMKKVLLSTETGVLLCGERKGFKVEGFDMGNSPLEFTADKVAGKTLITSSTNGTRAVRRASGSAEVAVASFLNGSAVAGYLLSKQKDLLFHLSGREDDFSYEDAAGAGFVIDGILQTAPYGISLSDSAVMALDLFRLHRENITGMLKNTFHGRYLSSIGFEKDLDFCGGRDTSRIIPVAGADGFIMHRPAF